MIYKRKYMEKVLIFLQKNMSMRPTDTLTDEYKKKSAECMKKLAENHKKVRSEVFAEYLRRPIPREEQGSGDMQLD